MLREHESLPLFSFVSHEHSAVRVTDHRSYINLHIPQTFIGQTHKLSITIHSDEQVAMIVAHSY